MNLKNMILTERSQSHKTTSYRTPPVYEISKEKQTSRDGKQIPGCTGLAVEMWKDCQKAVDPFVILKQDCGKWFHNSVYFLKITECYTLNG